VASGEISDRPLPEFFAADRAFRLSGQSDPAIVQRTTMSTATTTTFDVSNVKRATEPLPEVPYKEAVEAQINPGNRRNYSEGSDRKQRPGLEHALPEAPTSRSIEACSKYHGRLLERVAYHPVMAAAYLPSCNTALYASRRTRSG
jgi:hypothetical protein